MNDVGVWSHIDAKRMGRWTDDDDRGGIRAEPDEESTHRAGNTGSLSATGSLTMRRDDASRTGRVGLPRRYLNDLIVPGDGRPRLATRSKVGLTSYAPLAG
jgi:hypothetical protein